MTAHQTPQQTSNCATELLGEERVVYDLNTHYVHRLTGITRNVWEQCNGHTSLDAMAEQLTSVDPTIRKTALEGCLTELSRAGLITGYNAPPSHTTLHGRRAALGTLAMLGAGMCVSLAPRAAEAASCVGNGGTCDTGFLGNEDCCSGYVCNPSEQCATQSGGTVGAGHFNPGDVNCETGSTEDTNYCCVETGQDLVSLTAPGAPASACCTGTVAASGPNEGKCVAP